MKKIILDDSRDPTPLGQIVLSFLYKTYVMNQDTLDSKIEDPDHIFHRTLFPLAEGIEIETPLPPKPYEPSDS